MAGSPVPLGASWRRRVALGAVLAALVLPSADAGSLAQAEEARDHSRDSRRRFRLEMPKTVRGDHHEILPVVDAIRAISRDPREQVVIVHHVTLLLVEYDSDRRVYGAKDYHATLDEMVARRDAAGWRYLRDDCDGRAVFAAHLLAALEIPWRLEVSYWKRHAWVSATVDGVRMDLLDLRAGDPELQNLPYRLIGRRLVRPSQPLPEFNWRRAWSERTGRDIAIGVRLGLLAESSLAGALRERFARNWARQREAGAAPAAGAVAGGAASAPVRFSATAATVPASR